MLRLVKSEAAAGGADIEERASPPTGRVDELLPLMQAAHGGDGIAARTFLATVLPSMLRVVRRVLRQTIRTWRT